MRWIRFVNVFLDVVAGVLQVDQGIGHHLTGAVKRHLAAAVGLHHGNIGWFQDMAGLPGQSLGEHGRVFAQPNFIWRSQVTVRGERLHRRQTWRVVDPPFEDQLWLVVNRH